MTSLTLICDLKVRTALTDPRQLVSMVHSAIAGQTGTGTNTRLHGPVLVDLTFWVDHYGYGPNHSPFPAVEQVLDTLALDVHGALVTAGLIARHELITDAAQRKRFLTDEQPDTGVDIAVHSLFAIDPLTNQPLL